MDTHAEMQRFVSTLVINTNDDATDANNDDLSAKEKKLCADLDALKGSQRNDIATDLAAEAYKLLYLYKALLLDVTNNDPIVQTQVFKNTMKSIELRAEEIQLLLEDRVDALKK